jgi:BASS family bile acid:Na+ symporter
MKLLEHIGNLISKYMAILVILMAGAALAAPRTFAGIAPHVSILLGIVMFGMGMTLRGSDFRRILEHPRDVCIGVLAQFTVMPLLAWLLAKGFALSPDLAVGVILVGTCPGGTSSNVMTYLARGDVALSVSMTMTTTLLAPLVTPFLTWQLAGTWVEVSFTAMMLSIVKVVILPIAAGVAMNAFFAEAVRRIVKLLPLVSITAIILIVGGVVAVSASRIMETGLLVMGVVICHNLLGYGIGFVLARAFHMDMAKAKAIAIEVGMQNSGLAASLAMLHFGAAAAIPGAIFSVWHNISGSLAANYLSGRQESVR